MILRRQGKSKKSSNHHFCRSSKYWLTRRRTRRTRSL